MFLIDFILNLAGLSLWLSWRASRADPLRHATPAALLGTLRRAEPRRAGHWLFLAALPVLVLLRAVFYSQVSVAVSWVPRLDLAFVSLAFHGDAFGPALLYSTLSLLETFVIFYFWLLTLAMIHRRSPDTNPFVKMLRAHLGRPARWPLIVQLLLPVLAVAVLWVAFHPLLLRAGVTGRAQSNLHLIEQGLLIGAGIYLSLKYLLPAILFVHLVTSYVFLGEHPFWGFIDATARNVLSPLARLPLRYARVDFAPVVGIIVLLLLLHALPNFVLEELSRHREPDGHRLTIWPS